MIKCPSCGAENPDGTKICVKCATPFSQTAKAGVRTGTALTVQKKVFSVGDVARDLVDALWLLLIIFLIAFGFLMEITHWTWPPRFTDTEEAQLIQPTLTRTTSVFKRKKHMVATEDFASVPMTEQKAVQFGSGETFFKKGKEEFDKKEYHSSFNYFKQSLEIDPTYAKAYFGLGYLYARFEMNDAATRMYEMALRFDPNYVDPMNNLAMMYYHAGNYDDAVQLFQKALALDSQNADCQYNLGSLLLEKNQPEDALQLFQKAATLRPDDPAIYNDMGLAYEKLGKKQEAEDSWQKVLQYSDNADQIQSAKTHLSFLQTQS